MAEHEHEWRLVAQRDWTYNGDNTHSSSESWACACGEYKTNHRTVQSSQMDSRRPSEIWGSQEARREAEGGTQVKSPLTWVTVWCAGGCGARISGFGLHSPILCTSCSGWWQQAWNKAWAKERNTSDI